MRKPLILIFAILILDQILKIWIKLNLSLGEEIALIGDWCKIHFIENEGMAFGMSFGGDWGKLFLTLFRIFASVLIFIYLRKLIIRKESKLIIYSMALIFAGAVGNIIDSLFYGLIFTESSFFNNAEIFQGGYGSFLHGRVVDGREAETESSGLHSPLHDFRTGLDVHSQGLEDIRTSAC